MTQAEYDALPHADRVELRRQANDARKKLQPVTKSDLEFLKDLGYRGPKPENRYEAYVLISMTALYGRPTKAAAQRVLESLR